MTEFNGGGSWSVEQIIKDSIAVWHSSGGDFPDLGPPYSRSEQEQRENGVDRYLDAIEIDLSKPPRTRMDAERTMRQITALMVRISVYALDIEDPYTGALMNEGFSKVGLELTRRAREMDPGVSMVDILQAARNAWTANALQLVFGREMRLTPGIFAYSMLYPYSDNYLDNASVSQDSKIHFNNSFGLRLKGECSPPRNGREAIIWQLVELIEAEYPREKFPQVHDSLLAIHRAQEESLRQIQSRHNANIDLAELTLTKGGTSVLADAYLAAGHLTEAEARFAFNWGVVLQLGDDLQDFHADRKRGSLTLFTRAAQSGTLDKLTNQTFRFAQSVMPQMGKLPNCPEILKPLLARSSRLLLIRSAANVAGFYSSAYLEKLETFSPLRFEFLKSRDNRFTRRRKTYAKLFEQVAPGFVSQKRMEPLTRIELVTSSLPRTRSTN